MTTHQTEAARPTLSAAALQEWAIHVEHIMRGIIHALNNRAAALSAVMELASDPSEDSSIYPTILRTELDRVNDLVATLRSIGSPKSGADAFLPSDAATEARTVLGLHAECRDRQIAIDAAGAPPVRVPRWMFVRALIAFGANAAIAGEPRIVVEADGEWATARVEGAPKGATSAVPGSYAIELARAMGGDQLETGSGFRVPTLTAVRKREGRAG